MCLDHLEQRHVCVASEKWVVRFNDGAIKDVEPGRSVSLQAGAKLSFGKLEGEIRV